MARRRRQKRLTIADFARGMRMPKTARAVRKLWGQHCARRRRETRLARAYLQGRAWALRRVRATNARIERFLDL